MPITTKVVSSNPVHGQVYSIQHYVIKFISDLRQADRQDITEILLKVALNTINLNSLFERFYLKIVLSN